MSKILVVDDELSIRELLQRILERDGHEVLLAASASEALTLIDSFKPSLAIIDLVMPEKGGLTLIMESLRAIPGLALIAMSGRIPLGGDSMANLSLQFGISCVLPKPFTAAELKGVVERALAGQCG